MILKLSQDGYDASASRLMMQSRVDGLPVHGCILECLRTMCLRFTRSCGSCKRSSNQHSKRDEERDYDDTRANLCAGSNRVHSQLR